MAELRAKARARIDRVAAADLPAEQARVLSWSTYARSSSASGTARCPGAVVLDRNVLEWRLDPASPHRIGEATGYGRRIVVVCNEGYSSSLAAATLQLLGLHWATDLVGGYQQWRTVNPPSVPRP